MKNSYYARYSITYRYPDWARDIVECELVLATDQESALVAFLSVHPLAILVGKIQVLEEWHDKD